MVPCSIASAISLGVLLWVVLRLNRTLSRCPSIGLVLLHELTFCTLRPASKVGRVDSCTRAAPAVAVQFGAITLSVADLSRPWRTDIMSATSLA